MRSLITLVLLLFIFYSVVISKEVDNPQTVRQASKNPLKGIPFHVEIFYRRRVKRSIAPAKGRAERILRRILNVPTAFWLESKGSVQRKTGSGTATALDILRAASAQKIKPIVTFVVYNLPNRDCASAVSFGEICCSYNKDRTCNFLDKSNKCEAGIREYKKKYIDVLVNTVSRFCGIVPMVLVIEPDSLPNLVTNLDNPKCSNRATQASYRLGVQYAVRKLKSACSKATIYVDAAHGGWLGWAENSRKFLREIDQLKITPLIRGFALNVANYQEMGVLCPKVGTCLPSSPTRNHACCRQDPCNLSSQYNPGFSLLNYAASLKQVSKRIIPGFDVHFLLDTGRNGVPRSRRFSCANWCNIRGAGLGLLPTTNTADPSMIDGYMWLKRPGESDGCTKITPGGKKCRRFNKVCGSKDSLGNRKGEPRAPEAGIWFDFHVRLLARNARLF